MSKGVEAITHNVSSQPQVGSSPIAVGDVAKDTYSYKERGKAQYLLVRLDSRPKLIIVQRIQTLESSRGRVEP